MTVSRKRVSSWPTYLVKDIPEVDRRVLSALAALRNTSVSDVIRSMLCLRFRLQCPQESYSYDPDRDNGGTTLLLRMQPKLAKALTREAEKQGVSKRSIIIETIRKGLPL